MSPFYFKRLLRSPAKHIGVLLVALVLSGLMCFLSVYREGQISSREATIRSEEVNCVVTNIRGTQSSHLRMGYGAAQCVTLGDYYRLPEFVKDIRMTKDLVVSIDGVGADIALTAVTSPKGTEALDPALGAEVTLFRGDFYTSSEMLLIVSEEAYAALGGETEVMGFVTDPYINGDFFPDEPGKGRGTAVFTVAGFYKGRGSEFFMPFEAGELLVDRISGMRSVDSLAFTAADNLRLDELREAAGDVFGTVDPDTDYGVFRFALTVHDEALSNKLAAFDQSIKRTELLIPFALGLALAAGLLMGFITTRSEKNAYSLSRSAGMTKRKLLVSALAEQLVLPLLACAVMGAVFNKPLPALAVLAFYAVGCLVAVVRAVSVSPSRLLREQE